MQLALDEIPPTRRYLIGVSGGRDSVVLLHELHRLGYTKLIVCHVNHRLRGRASTQDAAFVKRLAARLGYPCEATSVDVAQLSQQSRQSIETAARQARHDFFAAMARKHRCPHVLLAHHAEDQAETVLMRVLRGTGIGGLTGMKTSTSLRVERTSLMLLRPMLFIRRAEIDAYITAHKLTFREDATNADTKPTRNHLRQSLLPQLNLAMGRDVTPMLLRLSASATSDDDLLRQLTDTLIQDEQLLDADGSLILKPAFKQAHPSLQHRVIHRWLREQHISDIDHDTVTAISRLVSQLEPARINLAQGLQVRRKSGRLSIASQSPQQSPLVS